MKEAPMSSGLRRSRLAGVALVTSSAVTLSAKTIFIKLAYRYRVDPIALLALRMAFSLPFFVAIALWHRTRASAGKIRLRDLVSISALGLVGNYLAAVLDFLGLQYISAGLERLILYLYPTMVIILSMLLFRRPIGRRGAIAMVLSYSGTALVFLQISGQGQPGAFAGMGLIFGSALAYALYLVGSEHVMTRVGSIRFTAIAMIVASLTCVMEFIATRGVALLDMPTPVYVLALAMAIFSTVLPAFLLSAGIRRIGSGPAAMLSMVGPISTIVLASLFLDEPISGQQLAGTALVLGGMLYLGRVTTA